MALKINVTWPEHLEQICIQMDCSKMEPISEKADKDDADITVDGAFGPGNRVYDDDRYRIGRGSEGPLECCGSGTDVEGPGADVEQTLVFLLESPHEHEYAARCIDRPLAPALGTTGRNIRDRLMCVIRGCNHIHSRLHRDVKVRVIIANPIQFQCSLVSVIQKVEKQWQMIRNHVWKALWSKLEIQNECKERLEEYRPDFIINACTSCGKEEIRDFLKTPGYFPNAHIYEVAHPSSWHFNEQNQKLRFIP